MKNLTGKTAFVTGAASGMGFGIASALSSAGVKVMLCDIDRSRLEAAVAKLRDEGGEVDAVSADVSLKTELQAAAAETVERFAKVHILINNAGVGGSRGYGAWNDQGWDWTIGINLMGPIWGVEIFGPLIESHGEGGQIVSTASVAGLVPGPAIPYHVTKSGVVALSEGLRISLAPKGIGVSVLCPGLVSTNILRSMLNVPERFGSAATVAADTPGEGEQGREFRERLETGIDPLYVGELVREGIENDWPYIFTDTEFEPYVTARFQAIEQGFDRIRSRTPRRVQP